jgi:hypothetical protein
VIQGPQGEEEFLSIFVANINEANAFDNKGDHEK